MVRSYLASCSGMHAPGQFRRGTALTEYALLLALAGGVMLLGTDMVGRSSADVMARLTHDMQAAAPEAVEAGAASADTATPRQPAAEANLTSASGTGAFGLGRLALHVALLASLGCAWLASRKSSRLEDEAAQKKLLPHCIQDRIAQKRQSILRVLMNDMNGISRSHLKVSQLMTTSIHSVPADAAAEDVRQRMLEHNMHHMLVVDGRGGVLGVISDRDLAMRTGKTARDVMTRDPLTVEPDMLVDYAVSVMLAHRVSSLPVMRDGELSGVLTSTDLMMAFQCSLHLLDSVGNSLRDDCRQESSCEDLASVGG